MVGHYIFLVYICSLKVTGDSRAGSPAHQMVYGLEKTVVRYQLAFRKSPSAQDHPGRIITGNLDTKKGCSRNLICKCVLS